MAIPPARDQLVAERYQWREQLGRGGFGVVWRAHDTLLMRDVAVKAIEIPGVLDDADRAAIRRKVLREARAAARLNHPGLVTVFDVIEEGDRPLIVMELVKAPTLAELVRREGPLAEERVATIGLAVLDALDAAHDEGIIHRDVKPANVMVSAAGHVQLADFGIAAMTDDPRVTSSMALAGSPSFMSPEQARNSPPSAATDLWGLGATLYFAVEGEPPFWRDGAIATLTAVVQEPHRPLARAARLRPLVDGLLAKDPAARPSSAEVRRRLAAVAAGAPASALGDADDTSSTREFDFHPGPADAAVAEGPPADLDRAHVPERPAPVDGDDTTGTIVRPSPPTAADPAVPWPGHRPVGIPGPAWRPPGRPGEPGSLQGAAGEDRSAPASDKPPPAPSLPPIAPAARAPGRTATDRGATESPNEPPLDRPQAGPPPDRRADAPPVDVSAPTGNGAGAEAVAGAGSDPGETEAPSAFEPRVFPDPARSSGGASPPASPPSPATTLGGRSSRRRDNRSSVVAVALVALVVAAVLVAALVSNGRSSSTSSPPTSAGAPSTAKARTSPTTSPARGTPAGWVAYRDPTTGFSIAHPPGWTVSVNGTLTDFRDPASGAYLRVDHREPPGPSPEGAWYQLEPSFAAQNGNYHRIQITPTTYDGYRAAVWEYTYTGGGADLHAVDLGFITPGHGFALNFQSAAGDWDRLQPTFNGFKASFAAPSG
ncbi:MAG: protein kinase [Acidimicrobiales bacterium]